MMHGYSLYELIETRLDKRVCMSILMFLLLFDVDDLTWAPITNT